MKKHVLQFIYILIFTFSFSLRAQVFDWTFGNAGQLGKGIATDSQGYSYLISSGISGSYGPFTFTCASQTLAKHDTSGNVIWVSWIKGVNCTCISIDRLNNIYIAGSCGNAVFASVGGTINVASIGYDDAFVAKYDSNGNILWVKTSGTSYSDDGFNVIKTDAFGNSYVCGGQGYYDGNLGYAVSNFVLSKYDTQGNLVWTKNSNWRGGANATGIDIDKHGNCYVSGGLSDSAFFDNTILTTNTYATIFLAKYDVLGNFHWAKKIGTGYDECFNLSYDQKNGLYLTGRHSTGSNFDGVTLTPKGMFIAKYDTSGSIIWAHHQNAKGGLNIASDSSGCYLVGWFTNSASLGSGNNVINLQTNKVNTDLFAAKYDAIGNLKWAISPGGSTADRNIATYIAIDNTQHIFITGAFNVVTIFGNTTLNQTDGIFLTRIKDHPNTIITASPENIRNTSMSLYPSPTNGLFNLTSEDLNGNDVQVRIINNLGETLYIENKKHTGGPYSRVFDLSSLPRGIYLVEVRVSKDRFVKKVVLE